MRRFFVMMSLATLASAGIAVCAGSRTTETQVEKRSPQFLEFRIHQDSIFCNGRKLTLGSPLTEWARVLGLPSRHVDRAGGMVVWDSLGLVATFLRQSSKENPSIAALWIMFAKRDVDFWPRSAFSGRLTFSQRTETTGRHPPTGELRPGIRKAEILSKGYVWKPGFPNLSGTLSIRFSEEPEESIEVVFLQIHSSTAKLGE